MILIRCTLHLQPKSVGTDECPMLKEFRGFLARAGRPLLAKALGVGGIVRFEAPPYRVIDTFIERAVLLATANAAAAMAFSSGTEVAFPVVPIVLFPRYPRHV